MSQITGVERLIYIVQDNTFETWARQIYRDGFGGRLIEEGSLMGGQRAVIEFPGFLIELRSHPRLSVQIDVFGDHYLSQVVFGVEDVDEFHRQYDGPLTNFSRVLQRKVNFAQHNLRVWTAAESQNAWLKRVDHLTFPVLVDEMDNRQAFWEVLGGVPQERKATGQYPDESMLLQGILFNKGVAKRELGIALVAGINGETDCAQVVQFLDANDLDQVQHVAFDVGDMEIFWPHFTSIGGNLLGEPIIAPDGAVQVFGWPYSGRNAAKGQYPEFLDRNASGAVKFQQLSLEGLHAMQIAASKSSPKPLFDCFREI